MNSLVESLGARARSLALNAGLGVDKALELTLDEAAELATIEAEASVAVEVRDSLIGYGALSPFLADPLVEEIWMNQPNELFVFRSGSVERVPIKLDAENQRIVIDRMLRSVGRRIDRSSPFADASLPDGSRLHVVMPDITKDHLSFNLRKFAQTKVTLQKLEASGTLTSEQYLLLSKAIQGKKSVLISGATAAGKTTLLNALINSLPSIDRVVSVDDTFELAFGARDAVAMQTRPPSIEGSGEVDLRRLVRESLRMRPTWLVVGEVRGGEAAELLIALNSGLPALCTIHANSADQALTKLVTLPMLAASNFDAKFVSDVVAGSIGLVVHCVQGAGGKRSVAEVKVLENA